MISQVTLYYSLLDFNFGFCNCQHGLYNVAYNSLNYAYTEIVLCTIDKQQWNRLKNIQTAVEFDYESDVDNFKMWFKCFTLMNPTPSHDYTHFCFAICNAHKPLPMYSVIRRWAHYVNDPFHSWCICDKA